MKYLNTFQVMASEDATCFLERVPGGFILVGSTNSECNLDYPHHHPKFDFDEEALVTGVSLVATAVSKFLGTRDSLNLTTSSLAEYPVSEKHRQRHPNAFYHQTMKSEDVPESVHRILVSPF